jgi:serine/threonine-protein kinase SRPK3
MIEMAGQVPPAWAPFWASDKYLRVQGMRQNFFLVARIEKFVSDVSAAAANAYWAKRRQHLMKGGITELEANRLIELLRSMLVLDPAERPSALQVLGAHTWLDETLLGPVKCLVNGSSFSEQEVTGYAINYH